MNLRKFLTLFVLLTMAGVILVACGGAATEEPAAEEPAAEEPAEEPVEGGAEVSGDVVVDGSSTVYPVTTAVAEEFQSEYEDVRVSVGLSGTGGGFEKFCVGETDISDASRPVKDEEATICADNGIDFTEFLVALDGLTVMVNPENDWLQCLTHDQLGEVFGVNSSATTWADIDSSFPDEPIQFFIPDPDSGTRDYMTEVVEDAVGDQDLRQDENTTFSSDDNVLLDGIANEEYALGFFGFAYYINNQDAVRAVPIENEAGECTLPSDETVQNGTYNPLSRPLFIYTNNESVRTKSQVEEFVRFYFSDAGAPAIMGDVGYSMPPEGSYDINLELIDAIVTGENPEGTRAEMGMGEEEMAEEETAEEEEEEEMAEEEMALEGDVVADGSSTVYPVTTAVAEEFQGEYPDVRVSVGLSGTGGGFEKFCVGETDISDASRPVKDEEATICADNGIDFTEFQVALDGLTVMVNPENDWVECLSADQLASVLGVNSTVTTWADIDSAWPAEPIQFFIPDPDSGTRDYMIEVVEDVDETQTDLRQDENTTFSSDDNVLLDGIANEEHSLGFFGFAYYINNQDAVRAVPIENDAGECVLPSDETVQNGTYNPLSRPLFIYTNNESVRTKPQVEEFVRFYFSDAGAPAVMGDVGYSLPPEGTYEENLQLLESVASE